MRLLFRIDTQDYDLNGTKYVRPSVRSIIIKNGKIGLVHSLKYDYYEFSGGGIEKGESKEEALIRETEEETGLIIIPETIQEYGYVYRIQRGTIDDVFIQENFYYVCKVETTCKKQRLDQYEANESFELKFVHPIHAINTNYNKDHGPKDRNMIERDTRVLELLVKEGIIR